MDQGALNSACPYWLCTRIEENDSTEIVQLREREGRFSITILATDPGRLLEFLNSLPEVSQALPEQTVPPMHPSLIFVDLSPF